MTLDLHLSTVRTFHELIGETVNAHPALLPGCRLEAMKMAAELREIAVKYSVVVNNKLVMRAAMAAEELAEWVEAHVQEDLTEAADAIADRLFVLLGDAVATGLPLDAAFGIVAESNSTKVASECNEGGKGIKGESFASPKKKLAQLLSLI
jgi:predicted HAD superfamily Cof-like phosphohydrolase